MRLHISFCVWAELLCVDYSIDKFKAVIEEIERLDIDTQQVKVTGFGGLELHVRFPTAIVDLPDKGPCILLWGVGVVGTNEYDSRYGDLLLSYSVALLM
ncbi:hypothetical protein [Alicyclobacillus sp. ALC3]|uniref:hypothetical protein n=1 Tax=Alicyclobacillus sp. ALC3 TaxID=2796143 RepID=UPI0023792EFF|nr:hypothetical protein [Alicyclobacillus sp. ALC3]WDL98777.1 hypothetical protein JC200_09040 [Alicyclobacillus sp. ALC3]